MAFVDIRAKYPAVLTGPKRTLPKNVISTKGRDLVFSASPRLCAKSRSLFACSCDYVNPFQDWYCEYARPHHPCEHEHEDLSGYIKKI